MRENAPAIRLSLVYTRTPWNEVPRARHYFAEALSKTQPTAFLAANTWSLIPGIAVEKIDTQYWLIQPSWFLPFKVRYRIPVLNKIYNAWLVKKLQRMKWMAIDQVITFDHTSLSFVNHFPNYTYYVNDDHTRAGAKKFNFWAAALAEEEKKLVSQAHMVVATATDLQARFVALNANTHFIPLGAPNVQMAPKMGDVSNKLRVVFLGVLNTVRIPMSLLELIHNQNEIELHCVGPSDKAFRAWASEHKHVVLHKELTGEALISFLQTCHVGIAPYQQNSANSGVTPSKLWHYFAAGLPVVYTKLPSIVLEENYHAHAIACDNNHTFVQTIEELAAHDTLAKREARMRIAQENTWQKRVELFSKLHKK